MSTNKQIGLLTISMLILFLVSACAKPSDNPTPAAPIPGACAKVPIVGKWIYNSDTLIIKDDCTGTNTACNYEFTYPTSILAKVHTMINFTKADVKTNCKSVGEHLINIELYYKGTTQETMYLNDGFGEYLYMRARE